MRSFVLSVWMPLALLLLWWLASSYGWVTPYLLPSPARVYSAFIELLEDGTLFEHIGASLGRAFGGYFAAVLFALPMGYFFAKSDSAYKQTRLILESLRMIPPLSLIPYPLLLIFFSFSSSMILILRPSMVINRSVANCDNVRMALEVVMFDKLARSSRER